MDFKKLFYLSFFVAIIFMHSCGIVTSKDAENSISGNQNNPIDTVYSKPLEIFYKSNSEIKIEINSVLMDNPEQYDAFVGHGILLDLFCDTTDCSVKSIEVDDDEGLNEISEKLVNYFNRFSFVNCMDNRKKIKVSHYTLLIFCQQNDVSFTIDYGYRID